MPRPSAKRHKDGPFGAGHHCQRRAPRFVIARPQRGRGALSAKREEVPLGCNLGKALPEWERHRRPYTPPDLTVAAFPAQPLAALPPYGCGVPLAGCERLGQLQISGYSADRTDFQICHCDAPKGPWQSRAGSYDFADGFPAIRQSTARLPRRFAPRNDNPSAFTVLLTTCFLHRCSAGRGMLRTHNAPSMPRLFFTINFRA